MATLLLHGLAMAASKKKAPPPPPPALFEEPLVIALAVLAVTALLVASYILNGGAGKVAICELGVAGRPCGAGPRKSISPQATPSRSHLDRAPSRSFVPERSMQCSGCVKLTQLGGKCTIEYDVRGLTPGPHGFHIHESADFSNGCVSAGPHYNPFGKKHGGPDDKERHVGDLGNITADATGVAKGKINSTMVKLSGPYTVIGRSIMVHADPDDLGKGDNSQPGPPPKNGHCSLVTGNAGARIACGEITLPGKK